MWDNNTPLKLLESMPNVLEKEHLEKLQLLIEVDRYKNQIISGVDMCGQGEYAPFCRECDKGSQYPCAIAYVNFMRAQGLDVAIAAEAEPAADTVGYAEEPAAITEEESAVDAEEPQIAEELGAAEGTEIVEEFKTVEEAETVEDEPLPIEEPAEMPKTTKIRIAIARKKTLL